MNILYLFMYIFGFKISFLPDFFNSTFIIGIVMFFLLVTKNDFRKKTFELFTLKKIWYVFSGLIIIISFSLLITMMNGAYDFSIIPSLVSQGINLTIGVILFSWYLYKNKATRIIDDIILVFVLQGVIQLISFVSVDIRELLNIFRGESAISVGHDQYKGMRGLALSGSAFFGLSAAYGLSLILFFINYLKKGKKIDLVGLIQLAILLFGGLSAGRTSLTGLFIGVFLYILFYNFQQKKKIIFTFKKILLGFVSFLITTLLIIYFVFNETLKNQFYLFSRFAFEMFYTYQRTGSFTTTSSNKLINEMYFRISNKTLFLGDGRYTNLDGSYYMFTDAGFMRNILFFGVIGTMLLIIYQLQFFAWNKDKRDILINLSIFTYILILNIKGDALGYLIILQNILLLNFLNEKVFNLKKVKE